MFILVSSYGSRGQQGKRERKHQEPILDLGTLRKEVCFPQGTAISKPRACLSPSPPPCVCLHLLPSPPCSSPFLFTTPPPPTPPSLSSSFLLPGTKGRRESRESGPAGPHWINQRHRPSPGATSLLICSGDSRGPPNHHMGPMSERRHEQSSGPEHGPERGPFRGGQDCRGPPDRRGPHPDFPDDFSRPDDFHPDKRFGHRLREFEGRGGPLPQEEKWRRGGPGPPFPPDHREFSEGDGRGAARGPPGAWEGRRPGDERFPRDPEDPRFRGRREESFRRGAPPRHEGRAPPRGRDGFPGPEDFGPEENFDASDETARGRDLRGRGRGTPRGGRKGLLPTPDEFPRFEGGRKPDSWDGNREPGPGHEHFRDAPRPDHPPHDGHSPASRERSSSLQGMDMASLPPRKRPWHDGPGTSEHREMEAPGGPSEDRGGKGRGGPGPSQRVPKSGRSSSLDGDHHDGYHRDEPFGGPPGSGTPSRGGRSGSNWGRGSNMNSGPPRRGASRGGGRGR